ncbi:MAG: hypothetical protein QOE61_4194, partial [Micromonosporaceae bacterium]|nr:hypothetical protein [Micromonosporaceae bacterium]
MHHIAASAGRAVSRLAAALGLLALMGGVPVWLAWAIGWPFPTTVPTSWDGWEHVLTSPIPDTAILHLLAIAGWLLWAAFARAVWVEAKAAWRGVHAPMRRSLAFHPLRALASFLIVTIAAGSIATTAAMAQPAAAATASGPRAPTASIVAMAPIMPRAATVVVEAPRSAASIATTAPTAQAPLLPAGPAVLVVNGCDHEYDVQKGDSLWQIAQLCLGDGARWPEIWDLNEGRFWPSVSGYTRFNDPDLIYPRWTLQLPAGASAPSTAPQLDPLPPTPATSPSASATAPAPSPTPSAAPTTAAPSTTPTTGATAMPGPAVAPPTNPAPDRTPATTTPTVSPTPTPAPSGSVSAPAADTHGVSLPDGSWVAWALAAAITAAAFMVWLQRRRRYIPGTEGDDLTDLPAPVNQLQRAVGRNPTLPTPADEAEQAAAVPALEAVPAGGIGLVGDGAAAAARAALIAVLASGGPRNPHERGEVVIDAATLATLIGSDAVTLGSWPRLHIADDADDALTILDARLLHRGRILDQHSLTDLDTLLAVAPDEEALPPMLVICEAPPAGSRMRAKVTFGLGAALHISALIVGEWEHGPTLDVAADGHIQIVGGHADEPMPDRMSVLEPAAAVQILLTLREAHTGLPPAMATPTALPAPIPLTATEPATAEPRASQPTAPSATADGQPAASEQPRPGKARLRVLGSPAIEDVTRPGKALRAKGLELAVYLACHP